MILRIAAVALVSAVAASAGAQMTYLAAERYVELRGREWRDDFEDEEIHERIDAVGFEDFDAVVTYGGTWAEAWQRSFLTATSIVASGHAYGASWDMGLSNVRGYSKLDVTFELSSAVHYSFFLDPSYTNAGSYLNYSLTGPGIDLTDQLSWEDWDSPEWSSVSRSGVLQAGIYRLQIYIAATDDDANPSYDFSFTVPAPAGTLLLGAAMCTLGMRRRC